MNLYASKKNNSKIKLIKLQEFFYKSTIIMG